MTDRLYFAVRTDLSEGRRAAQLIHAMDGWAARHGPQQGTVIVFAVPDEETLLEAMPGNGRTVVFREPDLDHEATAFATDQRLEGLTLLGSHKRRKRRRWQEAA
jgi:hypothetical protein